ncbi:hypothetical protein, partial [Paraburkholderia diazotrophica]|uniref:hypothetical protein n=1 Tax=Paraburkholderia diazotrophica TaxID=667676 RepID=UPI0031811892
RGMGNAGAAQTLCQAMILTGLLAEAGYGEATFEQMRDAEDVISAAFDRGRDSGVWSLDENGFRQFAVIVSTYDRQLRRAPLAAVADASDRLERFRVGPDGAQTRLERTVRTMPRDDARGGLSCQRVLRGCVDLSRVRI